MTRALRQRRSGRCVGVAYKPDVVLGGVQPESVMSASPPRFRRCRPCRQGCRIRNHDFYGMHSAQRGAARCVEDLDTEIAGADVALFLTSQEPYDLDAFADRAARVFDTRNARRPDLGKNVVPCSSAEFVLFGLGVVGV